MCGFAGFAGSPDSDLLNRMGERVRHRGPDQDGVFSAPDCSLIHKRLSIIDLSEAGRQPMSANDGRYAIAYNGEIYNYRALREKYASEGWVFTTQTDTECFLASMSLHELRDLDQFHGIFAFALWDAKEKRCFIARDRMGIKPLFYASHGGRFVFASEIPALLEIKKRWKINLKARAKYFSVGYISGPETIFEGICSLEPGSLFSISNGAIEKIRTFNVRASEPSINSFDEAKQRLIELVDKAVADQLVSDRPIGVFLSGGLDSSVVLSSMRKAQPSGKIKTFTTRFLHDTTDPKFNRDAELAIRTAQRYDCEHHEIEVGPENVISEAENIASSLGQPHHNNSTIALDSAARLASKVVSVVLSGDGGDESFGGYERYRLLARYQGLLKNDFLRSLISKINRRNIFKAKNEAERLLSFHAPTESLRRELFGSAVDDATLLDDWRGCLSQLKTENGAARFMSIDRETWLRDDAFVRSDRLTMRYGLELRVPLTDDTIVSFASGLPSSWHVDGSRTKILWRSAFSDRCLPEIINEPKRGWFPPHAKWMRAGLKDWTRSTLEDAIATHSWMNGPALRQAFSDHLESRKYRFQEIWMAISYHLWWKSFRDQIEV